MRRPQIHDGVVTGVGSGRHEAAPWRCDLHDGVVTSGPAIMHEAAA